MKALYRCTHRRYEVSDVTCKVRLLVHRSNVGCVALLSVYTVRSPNRPVGPTGRTDRPVGDQSRCSVGSTCCLRHSYIAAAVIYTSDG